MPLDILTADVLGSDATGGEVRLVLGDATTGDGVAKEAPIYGPDGFVGRPNPPDDEGNAAQALYTEGGDDTQVLGIRDNRWADKVGTMDPGDRGIITDAEARIFVKQARSAVSIYTLNVPADKSMLIDLGGIEGKLQVVNGGAVLQMEDGVINLGVNGGGNIKIDSTGVTISGSAIQLVAPVVQLGDMLAGTPPPNTPANACGYGPPAAGTIASSKVFVAP